MDYTVKDLITIAAALSDIERGFNRAYRRNKEINFLLDRVPVNLRGELAGYALRDADGRLTFQPLAAAATTEEHTAGEPYVESAVLPLDEDE